MDEYSCNSTRNIFLLSEICLDDSNISLMECVIHYDKTASALRYTSGIWLLLIAIFGIFGNLATLLSIPLAAKRKLYGLNRNFKTTTVFIMNLSCLDLCWCLFVALPSFYQQTMNGWPFGTILCKAYVIVFPIVSLTESMALGLIAISRCFELTKVEVWRRCTSKQPNLFLLLLIPWLLALPSAMPYFLSSSGVEAGWNCLLGACSAISTCTTTACNDDPIIEKFSYKYMSWYFFIIPIMSVLIALAAYIIIWRKVRKSITYLKKTEMDTTELQKSDIKMTRTILLLILVHFICTVPALLIQTLYYMKFIPDSRITQDILIISTWISDSIIALNFFIYAGSNEQYRNAYIYFWKYFPHECCRKNKVNVIKTTTEDSLLPLQMRLIIRQLQRNKTNVYTIDD